MPIADELLAVWTRQIKPRLSAVLQRSIPSGTCVQEFMMAGRRPDALKPMLVITCGNIKIKKLVEKSFKSQGWLQQLLKTHHIVFIALVAEASESSGPASNEVDTVRCEDAYTVQSLPFGIATSCGLELLIAGDHSQPRQRCTLGGLLVVNGKLWGLTARHPFHTSVRKLWARDQLEADWPEEDSQEDECSTTASEPFVFNDDDDDDDGNGDADDDSSASSTMPLQDKGDLPLSSVEGAPDENCEGSNPMRLTKFISTRYYLPHSAIFSPFWMENHSSAEEARIDYDWALLDLPSAVRALPNKIAHIDHRHDILIDGTRSIATSGEVTIAVTLGIGPQLGYLHSSPATFMVDGLVREVHLITLERILPLGSSGAWVLRGDKLYGYIVAVRQDVPWAYMTAIEPVLEDIRKKLKTEDVRLPRAAEVASLITSPEFPVVDVPNEVDGDALTTTSESQCSMSLPAERSKHPLNGNNHQEDETVEKKSRGRPPSSWELDQAWQRGRARQRHVATSGCATAYKPVQPCSIPPRLQTIPPIS
ncbi:hypothetical protein A1O7_04291 [Cladophialophora yegresii CBS 114405]|uniref:Uncharacterized protein n=1 Tax=Cladophialophora yegresii CBS 114405 TaxID=1182544 RepID=W9WNY9_9EURO|nr:uncharacterized protein A1O7_04291 [Cladophialophora yegresii CBS 114405]EXJ60139.1 hypothetical protein A1O7_04291 [Cladophialophora yegresii CBS 114405]